MTTIIAIACGGAVGAVLRYVVSGYTYKVVGHSMHWGTIAVNLIGAFIIGLLWSLGERISIPPLVRSLLFIGILGSFTTFSTFCLENMNLIRSGNFLLALSNIFISNIGGILLVFLGYFSVKFLLR